MPKLDVFPACRLRSFAELVSQKLGVQVRLKGREICVRYGKPPVVFLPNLEYAKESDLLPIYGFALHEAGHLKYSDPKVGAKSPNYLVKMVHNAVEDTYTETRLEAAFPGARHMLERAYVEGTAAVCGERPMVERVSYLDPAKRPDVMETMQKMGMDADDEKLVDNVAERMEIMRACKLWILEARRYPLPLYDWPSHPWHQVFHEETTPPAKNSQQAYDQAVRIIQRLGVQPCLPDDVRPIIEAEAKAAEAKRLAEDAKVARRAFVEARRARNAEIKRNRETCLEHYRLQEAIGKADEIAKELEKATKASARLQRQMEKAAAAIRRMQERSAREQQRLKDLQEQLSKGECEEADALKRQIEATERTIGELAEAIARKQMELEELQRQFADADARLSSAKAAHSKSKDELDEARKEYEKEARRIGREVAEQHRPAIEAAAMEMGVKQQAAKNAAEEAEKSFAPIKAKDRELGEQIAPGAVAAAVKVIIERHRSQTAEEELEGVMSGVGNGSGERAKTPKKRTVREIVDDALPARARKYMPLTREHDRVDKVAETPEGRAEYENARREYARIIADTAERLRRLYSPSHTKVKVNAENGRLDPRKAFKLGLARNGVAVDLSKVWRTITVRKDPKVAVSLLLDVSGSMSGEPLELARGAAVCLAEVMRGLGIAYEVLAHSTASEEAVAMLQGGELTREDAANSSRIVPFRGYVLKAFEESLVPASVFSDLSMEDNLDGEAVLWAVQRLAARPERTKLCISVSDGMPNSTFSNCGELERHLLMVCKAIEAREREGLYLFGLGIGVERIRKFFRNADVISDVGELPRAVLGIVEHVLANIVGRLG